MNKREFTSLLKEQTRQALEREQALLEQIERQSVQINQLSYQLEQQAANIKDLTAIIESMGESLRLRDSNTETLKVQNRALGNLMSNKSEKMRVDILLMMERFEAVLRKVIESDTYPDAIRLACFQHCKRKFLEIMPDSQAEEIITMTNLLYREEHKIQPDWTPEQILNHRQKYAPPILEKLKDRLTEIKNDPLTLPKSPLAKATNYMLGQFDALSNYILQHDYDLDNNAIEQLIRFISIRNRP